jgi:chromosomal replication initiation ATPase DnaA
MSLPYRVATIIRNVAAEHGLEPGVLVKPVRAGRPSDVIACAARHAMIECRRMDWGGKPPSYPQIGRWFSRNHTTVMHACRDMTE